MSQGNISNLKMTDFDNTGSGWNSALNISPGSSIYVSSAEISGSTDGVLVNISDESITEIEDSTLMIGSTAAGIEGGGSSRLNFRNSTISRTVSDGSLIHVDEGSSGQIRDSTLTLDSGQKAIAVSDSSELTSVA